MLVWTNRLQCQGQFIHRLREVFRCTAARYVFKLAFEQSENLLLSHAEAGARLSASANRRR